MLHLYLFKYAITGIQLNNKENYQKLIHVASKYKIFGKILNFWIYFPKSIINMNSKSFIALHKI